MGKMTESDLSALLDSYIAASLGKEGGRLSEDRRKALAYYYGKAEGDLAPPDIEGRSSYVATEVADTIEWIMPTLMRIFTAGDNAVEFLPQQQQDELAAKQATEYVNYCFYRQNDGFLVLHTWFKDALLQKFGVVYSWWDKRTEDVREEYRGLSPEELGFIQQNNPDMELIEQTEGEQGIDAVFKRSRPVEQVRVDNIPPEDFIVDPKARSLSSAGYVGHRVERTLSELRAAGYPKDKLDRLGDDKNAGWNTEASERAGHDDETSYWHSGGSDALDVDESSRKVWVYELYLQCDYDGDGIAEWRQVKRAGSEIMSNQKVDDHPYSGMSPILMPHRLIGRSLADLVMDLQRLKTAIMRQALDNLYLMNNARNYVDMTKRVNLDDLLNSRPGGVVRGYGENGVQSLAPAPIAGGAFQMIEYVDTVKENRTGVTRYNQGIDANSLNKTASGITQIMSASQQRIELIARVLAETGVKDLFRKLLKLVSQNQSKAQVVRLTGGYVEIDPRAWKNQFDMTINVGLGTGNKDQQAAHLTNLLQMQQGLAPAGIVTPRNLYETAKRLPEALGFKGEAFFTDPTQGQQQPQGPSPQEMQMQAEQAKFQADQQEKQARFQLEAQKAQMEQQVRMAELELKREELALKRLELEQRAKQADEDRELKLIEIASKAPLPPQVVEPEIIDAEDAYPDMFPGEGEQYPETPDLAGMGGEMLPDQLSDDSLPPEAGIGPEEGMTDD
ncbi:MAG: cell envelope integrity protein TolA [Armatimonadia bacterium]